MSKNCGWLLGSEGSLQQKASKMLVSSESCMEMNFASNLDELRSRHFSSQHLDCRLMRSSAVGPPNPLKLENNKCRLFKLLFMIIDYTRENYTPDYTLENHTLCAMSHKGGIPNFVQP